MTAAGQTRLIGLWMSVSDLARTREFYERIGARFDPESPPDQIARALLGSTRLVFEVGGVRARDCGPALLVGVADTDGLYDELIDAELPVEAPPRNERWGRQFDILDPDGNRIAFIGPVR